MATQPSAGEKTCVMCGVDCAHRPRTRDRHGRYFCAPCYERAVAQVRARAATPAVAAVARPAAAAAASQPRVPPPPAPPPRGDDALVDLLDVEAHASAVETARPCPGCGSTLPPGVKLCTACGYNLMTGRNAPGVAAAPAVARDAAPGEATAAVPAFFQNPTVLGCVQCAAFVLFGWLSEGSAAFFLIAGVYMLGIGLWALVAAFRDGILQGLLSFIWFYQIYWVFARNDNPYLKACYAAAIVANIVVRVL